MATAGQGLAQVLSSKLLNAKTRGAVGADRPGTLDLIRHCSQQSVGRRLTVGGPSTGLLMEALLMVSESPSPIVPEMGTLLG